MFFFFFLARPSALVDALVGVIIAYAIARGSAKAMVIAMIFWTAQNFLMAAATLEEGRRKCGLANCGGTRNG